MNQLEDNGEVAVSADQIDARGAFVRDYSSAVASTEGAVTTGAHHV